MTTPQQPAPTSEPAYRFDVDRDGDAVVMKDEKRIAWQDPDEGSWWNLIVLDSGIECSIACPTGKELTPAEIGALHEAVVALRGRS